MSKSFWTTGRIAGALLVLGFALIVAQFIVVLVQGKLGVWRRLGKASKG